MFTLSNQSYSFWVFLHRSKCTDSNCCKLFWHRELHQHDITENQATDTPGAGLARENWSLSMSRSPVSMLSWAGCVSSTSAQAPPGSWSHSWVQRSIRMATSGRLSWSKSVFCRTRRTRPTRPTRFEAAPDEVLNEIGSPALVFDKKTRGRLGGPFQKGYRDLQGDPSQPVSITGQCCESAVVARFPRRGRHRLRMSASRGD